MSDAGEGVGSGVCGVVFGVRKLKFETSVSSIIGRLYEVELGVGRVVLKG